MSSIEITDAIVKEVGDEIGMHHGGWDTENPKDIIRASVWVVLRRLSPAVRELLLTNPEAVERSVQAVMSHDPDDVAATMNAFAELSPIIREMMLDNMSEFRRMVDKAYSERLAAEMIASLYDVTLAATTF